MKRVLFTLLLLVAGVMPAFAQSELQGQIFSVNHDGEAWPIGSTGGWNLQVVLKQRDLSTGELQVVNATNCEAQQGCADQWGRYSFTTDWWGNSLAGSYVVEVTAWGHSISRIPVEVTASTQVIHRLTRSPGVLIPDWNNWEIIVDSNGWGTFDATICGMDDSSHTMAVYATVQGPSLTQSWESWDIAQETITAPVYWSCEVRTMRIYINSELPDGERYFMHIQLGAPSKALGSDTWLTFVKGSPVKIWSR